MITLTINETASALLGKAWQADVLRGLRWTMAQENDYCIGEIRRYNRGKGPFPVSENKLGVKTRRWAQSIRQSIPRVRDTTVFGSIGSNVEYAAAHEFGFRGNVSVRGIIRRVTKAVGKKGNRKTVNYTAVTKHDRMMDVPARAPITTGIEKHKPKYEAAMSKSIIETLRGLGYS